jgi:NAD(P)-dependent dehydrogenase (short-subunit alcohol dehydrogenase family)
MPGRTIVITGASDGIGASAARTLSKQGENVVIVGRSPEKTAAVAKSIGADFYVADFADLSQVRSLAATLLERYPRIDVLANNAGGIMGKRELTIDGHEKTLQVNHLAPFLLTTLLLDRLKESKASVIATASVANSLFGRVFIDDLENKHLYSANRAYGTSKLENILFTRELNRRFAKDGISAASFHPGVVATSFSSGSSAPMRVIYQTVIKRLLLTPEKGADTLVWLATARPGFAWKRGEYFVKRKVARPNRQAFNSLLARQLWEKSEALVGEPAKA